MASYSHIPSQFGKRIRALRLAKGLSQEDLEERSGLDRTYISSLERGKRNVSLKNVAALAASLDITLTQLFEGIDLDEQPPHS